MTLDTYLLIARIAGSVFAGIYGLYATVTDFHETKQHKKVLSRKGKLGLALLLAATAINVGSDGIKEKRDLDSSRADSVKRQAETAKIETIDDKVSEQLITAVATTQQLKGALSLLTETNDKATRNVHETERLLDPIHNTLYAEFEFTLPKDQAPIRAYIDRVHPSPSQPTPPVNSEGAEADLYSFITALDIAIVFTKSKGHHVLVFRAECQREKPPSEVGFWFEESDIIVSCNTVANKRADDGTFRSYSDLPGSDIFIQVAAFDDHGIGKQLGITYKLTRATLEVTDESGVRLHTARRFRLNQIKMKQRFTNGVEKFSAKIAELPVTYSVR